MSITINDPALQSQLSDTAEAKLCDSTGKPLGHFVSPTLYRMLVKEYVESQVSVEELDRRYNEPGGSTLQQIWAKLESR